MLVTRMRVRRRDCMIALLVWPGDESGESADKEASSITRFQATRELGDERT
jgi:hypothetical protein